MTQIVKSIDVVILGGGPAGTATALKLKQRAPSLGILLVERTSYREYRIGEILPPGTKRTLQEIDAWEAFCRLNTTASYGIDSAWGQSASRRNDFFFQTAGHGWVVDRTGFDKFLSDLAEQRGIDLNLNSRAKRIKKRQHGGWTLEIESKKGDLIGIESKFIVDATGRTAAFARTQGAQPVVFDNLVGIHCLFNATAPKPTLIEAFENGWWYSTSLPNGQRLVSCFSDGDLAKSLSMKDHSCWKSALQTTKGTWSNIRGEDPTTPLSTVAAHTQHLDTAIGDNWLVVGDAASTFDPLSSQGILKGLRNGIFAAYAIADFLHDGECRHLEKYRHLIAQEFNAYLESRTAFYCSEKRWKTKPFWQRRIGAIELDPSTVLTRGVGPQPKRSFFLTPCQIGQALVMCQSPKPAHRIVSNLQRHDASLSTQRIILGLQHLLKIQSLTTSSRNITTIES